MVHEDLIPGYYFLEYWLSKRAIGRYLIERQKG
jgi:hypothetical protein